MAPSEPTIIKRERLDSIRVELSKDADDIIAVVVLTGGRERGNMLGLFVSSALEEGEVLYLLQYAAAAEFIDVTAEGESDGTP